MRNLFMMECKKTARGVLYWLYVMVLFFVSICQFDAAVESELRGKDNPSSVFYTAPDGIYVGDSERLSDVEMQENMMAGASARLLDSYRKNAYEYYPFGYVKTKTLSEEGQRIILSYLEELTGMSEEAINGTAVEDGAEDFQISGGGAFVFEPGQGSMNENGQYVIEPGDWKYMENNDEITGASEDPENGSEKVTFDRFQEIMGEVDGMIGRNSYFSKEMLALYYYGNDMEESPVTGQQHREFYEGDHVTGAFARYYCDSISLVVLGLPALVVIELMMRDKKRKMQALVYQRTVSGIRLVCTRFAASVCMVMLPVLIFPIKPLVTLVRFCMEAGVQPDVFAFAKYSLLWILPTVLLVMAIGLFLTVLTENYSGILIAGLLWLAGRPSIGKIAGGNYDLFDLIIRHNTLKGYGRMMENIRMLVMNRAAVSSMAFLFVALSVVVYEVRRKGVESFENRKLFSFFTSNIRINYKNTLIPSILLLLVIPLIYGTADLDYIKSADCLERMVALIGIPMFTSLFYREQIHDLYGMVALRPFPFRAVAALRIGISMAGTFILVMAFEVYMCARGCNFLFGVYAVRTFAACTVLGFAGLLCASVAKNTVAGYLGAFCFYFVVQAGTGDSVFKPVTNGIHPLLIIFLSGAGAAILLFCKPAYQ